MQNLFDKYYFSSGKKKQKPNLSPKKIISKSDSFVQTDEDNSTHISSNQYLLSNLQKLIHEEVWKEILELNQQSTANDHIESEKGRHEEEFQDSHEKIYTLEYTEKSFINNEDPPNYQRKQYRETSVYTECYGILEGNPEILKQIYTQEEGLCNTESHSMEFKPISNDPFYSRTKSLSVIKELP